MTIEKRKRRKDAEESKPDVAMLATEQKYNLNAATQDQGSNNNLTVRSKGEREDEVSDYHPQRDENVGLRELRKKVRLFLSQKHIFKKMTMTSKMK